MSRICSNCFAELPDGENTCPVCGYSPDKDKGKYPMALPAGTVLDGRYILGRTLGQGGFGITYVAKDHKTGNLVAVKEYFPETLATRTTDRTVSAFTDRREENFLYGKECFLKEAETLAQFIGNPNIVKVYIYFEENNTAYFVMDYVQGVSFRDYLKEHGKISWEEAKSFLFPIMDALSEVHSKGIIHRDVTPDNIYITKDGLVKLLDFGAARYSLGDRSRSLDVVLKPGFAPREQYSRHGRQGPYTDVYALAATYYFAITGRLPPDSIDRQDHDELILPSSLGVKIPPEEEDALCKALAVSSFERFQNMEEFKQALLSPNPVSVNTPKQTTKNEKDTIDKPKTDNNAESKLEEKKKRKFSKKTAVIAACAFILSLSITISVLSIVFNASDSTPVSVKVTEESTKKTTTEKQTEKKTQATTKATEKKTEAATEKKTEPTEKKTEAPTKATDAPETTTESFDNRDMSYQIISAINDIEGQEGYEKSSGYGALVEVDGGSCFMALYNLKRFDGYQYSYFTCFSLFDFSGNGIKAVDKNDQICLLAGGNKGCIGLVKDANGNTYCAIYRQTAPNGGDLVEKSIQYIAWDKNGINYGDVQSIEHKHDYINNTDQYFKGYNGLVEVNKQAYDEVKNSYTEICILDLNGNSQGNVLSFYEFRNKYE